MSSYSTLINKAAQLSMVFAVLTPAYGQTQPQTKKINELIVKLKQPAGQNSSAAGELTSQALLTEMNTVITRIEKQNSKRFRLKITPKAKNVIYETTVVVSLGAEYSPAEAENIAGIIAKDVKVAYAEPNRHFYASTEPNDPYYAKQAKQWGLYAPAASIGGANLPAAWTQTQGLANITVAIIDTGYRPHVDLKDNLLPHNTGPFESGYDFTGEKSNPKDAIDTGDFLTLDEAKGNGSKGIKPYCGQERDSRSSSWHGSHVAGIIGAATNNGEGIAGISWHSKLLPMRALGKCDGNLDDIAAAMRWAAGLKVEGTPLNEKPAQVLNLSLGSYDDRGDINKAACSQTFLDAISAVRKKGVTVVVAAGNEDGSGIVNGGDVARSQPANCPGVITVGAHDKNGDRGYFSNTGSMVTISAPGVDIWSTVDLGDTTPTGDAYESLNGTSMATPHVAGTVALMLSVNPRLNPDDIKKILKDSARPFPASSDCMKKHIGQCGAGLLDAGAAVSAAYNYRN